MDIGSCPRLACFLSFFALGKPLTLRALRISLRFHENRYRHTHPLSYCEGSVSFVLSHLVAPISSGSILTLFSSARCSLYLTFRDSYKVSPLA